MIVTIHQPEHLPWLGFFNKMANADEIIILDNVQYRKGYFQNRNKILINGEGRYIGVPVKHKDHLNKTIADMEIYSDKEWPWKKKYLKAIEYNYKRHPYFNQYFPFFEDLLGKDIISLYEFNMQIIAYFAKELEISTKMVRASDLSPEGNKSDLILDLSKRAGAKVYLSGPSGRDYLDLPKYDKENIEVWFNDFVHPAYFQKGSGEFVSYLSTLDLLMNVGAAEGKKIISSGTVIVKNNKVGRR